MSRSKEDYVAGDIVDAVDLNKISENGNDSGGFVDTLNAGETINGATLPVPVYQDETDGELYACDANVLTKLNFIGFATSNSTNGNPIDFQGSGIVSGFSGLTAGSSYYVQDSVGTIGKYKGTYRILVGYAINTTQLLITKRQLTLLDRGILCENGLFVSWGKDWIAGGSGTLTDTRKTLQASPPSAGGDDEGSFTNSGNARGDSSTTSNISFSFGVYFSASTYIDAVTGNLDVYGFFGVAPQANMQDGVTQVQTAKHIGFWWKRAAGGGTTWTLYTSNANGTTQTINTIGGYTNPFTEMVYSFEYDTASIKFYIDNVLVATHTTNLPTGQVVNNNIGVYWYSDAGGGTSRFNNAYLTKQKSFYVSSFN